MSEDWLDPSYEKNLVSVIIPCHNQARFLRASLDSVANQEHRPIEIIVVDDGSTDATKSVIEEFQNIWIEGISVKSIFQKKHGAPHARNQGCMHSRGEFIQFLDGDDVLCLGKLSGQVAVLNNNKLIDVIYGDGQYLINDFGGTARFGRIISRGYVPDIIESILSGAWVPIFAYLSRRSAIRCCGPWDNTIQISQDYEYFLRMALSKCKYFYSAGITGYYRKYSFNTISEQSKLLRVKTTEIILFEAERILIDQSEFKENRIHAMAENYRRMARWAYPADLEIFNKCIDNLIRLCPRYKPKNLKARFISSIFGFRNYEKFATLISRVSKSKNNDWY